MDQERPQCTRQSVNAKEKESRCETKGGLTERRWWHGPLGATIFNLQPKDGLADCFSKGP